MKDDKVPKDLFDYVSFLNEAPAPVVYKKTKGSSASKAGRGRGRPAYIPVPMPGLPPDATGAVMATLTTDAPIDTTEAQVDTQLDEGMQVVKDEPTVEGNETEAAPAAEYIKITHSHPMMGLWEGSFNVKSATGK